MAQRETAPSGSGGAKRQAAGGRRRVTSDGRWGENGSAGRRPVDAPLIPDDRHSPGVEEPADAGDDTPGPSTPVRSTPAGVTAASFRPAAFPSTPLHAPGGAPHALPARGAAGSRPLPSTCRIRSRACGRAVHAWIRSGGGRRGRLLATRPAFAASFAKASAPGKASAGIFRSRKTRAKNGGESGIELAAPCQFAALRSDQDAADTIGFPRSNPGLRLGRAPPSNAIRPPVRLHSDRGPDGGQGHPPSSFPVFLGSWASLQVGFSGRPAESRKFYGAFLWNPCGKHLGRFHGTEMPWSPRPLPAARH